MALPPLSRTLQRTIVGALACLCLTSSPASLVADSASTGAQGIAWRVQGGWSVAAGSGIGRPTIGSPTVGSRTIRGGDLIAPGSLLQPLGTPSNHSITVLLPDGQRVLYECFTDVDCARGFRVPGLYRKPDPFALEVLARIERVLANGNPDLTGGYGLDRTAQLPRDEVLAVLGLDRIARVGGLAARLGNGRYYYDLQPVEGQGAPMLHQAVEKTEPSLPIPVPRPGLYIVTISDQLNTPRIQLFLAAVPPTNAERAESSFRKAQSLMKRWNEFYFGWPVHEFQWAYLASLASAQPASASNTALHAPATIESASAEHNARTAAPDTTTPDTATPEPSFSPLAGVFAGDTEVTVHCAAPGATIHYTVDGSQPSTSSFVYHAPIVVKATELTIKAFASTPGRPDSPVVTGIFRIQEP